MKKRALSLLMAVLMVIGLLPATARAADGTLNGDISVGTAAELAALGGKDIVGNITLTANIDMSETAMTPIKSLKGCFNGDSKTISRLTLKGGSGSSKYDSEAGGYVTTYVNTGLIGELDGSAINLKMTDVSITGIGSYNNVGTLVGYIADGSTSKIDNCIVSGTITSSGGNGSTMIGGLAGYMSGSINEHTALTINNSVSNVSLKGARSNYVGGLLGTAQYFSDVTITKCAVLGDLSENGNSSGVIGYINSVSTALTLSDSYLGGKVDGDKKYGIAYNSSALSSLSCTNFYYDNEKNKSASSWSSFDMLNKGSADAEGKSTSDLKSLTMDGFAVRDGEFGGYPVPKWTPVDKDGIPKPVEPAFSCKLTFTGTEGGTLSVYDPKGNDVPANEDGSYTLSSAGDYTYTLTFNADSIYRDITNGSFTVLKTETEKAIAVKLTYKTAQPSGDGTEKSPYLIGTAEELRWFAERVNDLDTAAAKAYVKLTKNIEVPGSWTPLGKNASYAFSGHFDGDGHSVTITVDDPGLNYFGFFGCLDSKPGRNSATPIDEQPTVVVENLTVNGTIYCFEPGAFVGGIAARAMGKVELKNCVNKATVSSLARASSGVGGLVGGYDDGVEYVYKNIRMTVDGCTNNGTITVTGDNEKAYVGGLVGSNKNCVQVKDSANTGTVNAPGCTVGGLLGEAGSRTGDFAPSIENSVNTGTLIGAEGKTNNLFGKGTISQDNIKNSGDNVYKGGEITDPLLLEAMKYNEVVAVPAGAKVGDAVDAIKDGRQPEGFISVVYSQGEKDTNQAYLKVENGVLKLAKENTTGKVIQATATMTWTEKSSGKTLSKPITVNIYPAAKGETSARKALMEAIAKTYRNKSEDWVVFDMAVYKASGLGENTTNVQNYLNLTVNALVDDTAPLVTDRAKGEIILAALGINSTKLKSLPGVEYSNAQKLADMNLGTSHYTAPWVLLAEQAGQLKLTDKQRNDMFALLTDSRDLNADGLFTYDWGTKTYIDVDTTATALNALVKYNTDEYPKVQGFITKAVAGLSKVQGSDGSYGNVNSDAMVILGLLSVGIDPAKDARFVKGGCSLADALLLYVNSSSNGFVVAGAGTGEQGDKARALATEQGFRALVALEKYAALTEDTEDTVSYNIYTLTAGITKADGSTETKPEQPTPDKGFESDKPGTPDSGSTGGSGSGSSGGSTGGETKSVTVRVTVQANGNQWVSGSYTVTKGQSALDALKKALDANGITYQAKTTQYGTYIQSLTRNGVTLGEMDKGPNSGWMYKVNGSAPMVGVDAYAMSEGDELLFYYVADYTKEDAGGSLSGGGQTKELPFTDVVDTSWFYAAVKYAYEHKLFGGTSATEFSPEATMTRGMAATILYSLEGSPAVSAKSPFSDVADGQWYAKAVIWAEENGIVGGIDSENFAPEAGVTREQLAAILYRYAQYKKYSVSVGEDTNILSYDDAEQISSYAVPAIQWACGSGLMTGRTQTTLAPVGTVTRAEVAVMLQRFCENNIK